MPTPEAQTAKASAKTDTDISSTQPLGMNRHTVAGTPDFDIASNLEFNTQSDSLYEIRVGLTTKTFRTSHYMSTVLTQLFF